ncbi:hypothetical protein [Sphingomonas sp. SAFR-052]|uniref:hypothetical protein n=1 Tax=Sphingomonas sp. SAFR-052 TaxID=3436867 RepID=UPI003F7CDC09
MNDSTKAIRDAADLAVITIERLEGELKAQRFEIERLKAEMRSQRHILGAKLKLW